MGGSLVVFALDLALRHGVALPVGYALLVLQLGRRPEPRLVRAVAGWCAALTLAGAVASPPGEPILGLANRALALLLLWAAARHMLRAGDVQLAVERLATAAEASPDGVIGVDDAGRVVSWNRAASELFGTMREAAIGRRLSSLFPPAWRDAVDELLARSTPGPTVASRDMALDAGEELVDVRVSASRVSDVRSDAGISVTVRDIAEEKRTEAALRAEAHYRGLLESAPDAMLVFDARGRIVLTNRQATALLGWPSAHLAGRRVQELLPAPVPEVVSELGASDAPVLIGGDVPLIANTRQGDAIPVELSLSPIHSDRGPLVAVAVRDVTARMEAEAALREAREALEQRVQERTAELRQANEDLQGFAYVASHDLKAPLRGIVQLAQWVQEDAGDRLPASSREHLQLILGRAARLMALIDDLLAYSRAGRSEGQVERIALDELFAEVVDLLAPPEGMEVVAQGPLPEIEGVRTAVRQVLFNLVGNAIKHHPGPPGRVWISATRQPEAWQLRICDDGAGIPPEQRQRVWRMFQTLKPRDQVEGSGMGLAIVRRIVRRHGGEVDVGASDAGGAAFSVTWPDRE